MHLKCHSLNWVFVFSFEVKLNGHRHVDYRICIQGFSAIAIGISDCHITPTADTEILVWDEKLVCGSELQPGLFLCVSLFALLVNWTSI